MQKDRSITRTQAYIQNLYQLKSQIEDASSMKDTVKAFEIGVGLLKQVNEEMFEAFIHIHIYVVPSGIPKKLKISKMIWKNKFLYPRYFLLSCLLFLL